MMMVQYGSINKNCGGFPLLPLAAFLLLALLLLAVFDNGNALIRNNRVILHDEHLPNGGGATAAGDAEEEEEGIELLEEGEHPNSRRAGNNAAANNNGDEQRWLGLESSRPRREVAEWRDEWKRKAANGMGLNEEEQNRVRELIQKMNEEMAGKGEQQQQKEERGDDQNDGAGTEQKSGTTAEKYKLTDDDGEQMREWRAWTRRRMSDQFFRRGGKSGQDSSEWPEEGGRHFEGDIVLSGDQAEQIYESLMIRRKSINKTAEIGGGVRRRTKRKFIGSSIRRWDAKKPIIYSFDGSHTLREQRVIELALEHWHNITCLNFERRNDEPRGSRIVFTDVDGCASNVGRHPLGEPQFVSLAPECIRLGVIAHEVAHALGFWHEQSRPDRDQWVQVQWENIDRDSKGQFLKEQPADVDNAGVPYDYGSIMHYRSKAFAKFDDLFTIGTFISDYQRTIGQRDQLSFNDIRLMNEIYCRDACPQQLACQRGGYTDPRHCDRCRCPDGFTGTFCDQVMPGYGADCGGRVELQGDGSWHRMASPNYPGEFREGQECSWLLVAPPGKRVQLQFYGEFEMYCKVRHSLCMDYVEVRNGTDFANTGMRYCCYGTPHSLVHSATRDLLVLFRSFYRGGRGFQARARAIQAVGELASSSSGGNWSEWGQWSECSVSCGGCGHRQRKRECQPMGKEKRRAEQSNNVVVNQQRGGGTMPMATMARTGGGTNKRSKRNDGRMGKKNVNGGEKEGADDATAMAEQNNDNDNGDDEVRARKKLFGGGGMQMAVEQQNGQRRRNISSSNNGDGEEEEEEAGLTTTTPICQGADTDTEVCAREPCTGVCTRTITEEHPCQGLLALLKGVRCRRERTKQEECREFCCAGFALDNKEAEGGGSGRMCVVSTAVHG